MAETLCGFGATGLVAEKGTILEVAMQAKDTFSSTSEGDHGMLHSENKTQRICGRDISSNASLPSSSKRERHDSHSSQN